MAYPPYRIETDRLVIRCWEPRDAAMLKEAIDGSLDELREWMPWAHDEPQSIDEKVDLLRAFRGRFDAGEDFIYGVFARDEDEVLGGSGLHTRVGEDAFEIGYWIRSSATRNGFATEVAAALTRVAFTVCEADRVEIHVPHGNEASRRIPQKLGYRDEARLRRRLPPLVAGGPRSDVLIFSMVVEEFGTSAKAGIGVTVFDAAGRLLA